MNFQMSRDINRLKFVLFVVVCLFGCQLSYSDELTESGYGNITNSRELFQPTPLITNLTRSAAEVLIQEANNAFVSNTSLVDLIQNNITHHLLLRYRERNRQNRLMEVQQDILRKLGLSRNHNVTSHMSQEERQSLVSSFDRTMFARLENDTVHCDDENMC
ncbi:uncharacterized protein [Parasteatoda tepidariorum]|uniref:uncharacterized protein isoform X1 n=1 Tax=Parasteatoda tepidariorum TaxID=114398 RepID=UPI0039BC7363